jgi:hypothetical protein
MGGGSGLTALLFGAGAGGLLALGAREAVLASPAAVDWVRLALEPLLRAGREGYSPSTPERRRLAVLGAGTTIVAGWFLGGPPVALPLAVAGPGLAAWAISNRRARYRSAAGRGRRNRRLADRGPHPAGLVSGSGHIARRPTGR